MPEPRPREHSRDPLGGLRRGVGEGWDALRREPRDKRDQRDRREVRDRAERVERRDVRQAGVPRRLDQPRALRRGFRPNYDAEAFGRTSETIARFLGTGRFLIYMTAFVFTWLLWNWLSPARFDPFPFIFLTLILSLQASYAAPLILLAQNRQDDRDRLNLERDREVTAQTKADMEFLAREIAAIRIALGDVATRDFVRSELRELLSDIEEVVEEVVEEDDDEVADQGPAAPGSHGGGSHGHGSPGPRGSHPGR